MATYLIINLIVCAGLIPVFIARRRLPGNAWWTALIALLILTAVFDNLIVGLGIVGYDPAKILGLRIGHAPIEDFFYPLVAMVVVPVLWSRGRAVDKLRRLALVSRPVSWINTAFPFAAGYLVMGGGITLTLIVGTLFFLIPYNLLMYGVNDVFDYESDIRNPRKGGIEGMREERKLHPLILKTSLLVPIPFVVYLGLAGTPLANLTLLGLLFFVIAYSLKGLRFKEKPLLDSITSSIHFVGTLVYALTLTHFSASAWPFVVAFFFWGMASHAFGAVQDIIPDREGGLASIATVFGARATVWFCLALYAAATVIMALQGGLAPIIGAVGLLYIANIASYIRVTDVTSARTNRAWRRFIWLNLIAGFVVTLVLIAAAITSS